MGQLIELRKIIKDLFSQKQIDESDLDWIVVDVLGCSRSESRLDRDLSTKEVRRIFKLSKKRFKGIPLSQVLKKTEFYGLEFFVNKHCLTPRPETELLVEEIMKENNIGRGLDIGTGSGAIAITLQKLKKIEMLAVDISFNALRVARKNNKKHKTNVRFLKSDLFGNIGQDKFDFIVSNPPYITKSDYELLETEVKDHEPKLALIGGESGLEVYEKIIQNAPKFLKENGKIYFEVGIGQAQRVTELLQKDFESIEIVKDYNKIDRIVKAVKK